MSNHHISAVFARSLEPNVKLLLLTVANLANGDGVFGASPKRLAELSGLTVPVVDNVLGGLLDCGIIKAVEGELFQGADARRLDLDRFVAVVPLSRVGGDGPPTLASLH